MAPSRVKLVAALARDRVIGRDNALPWHLPEDLKRFRRLTLDRAVLMGRRTYESIGRPLPRRTNIVITRRPDFAAPGAVVVGSLAEGFERVPPDTDAMVIGGGEIYAQALPLAGWMHLTLIDLAVEGDVRFPDYAAADWVEVQRELHPAVNGVTPAYDFVDLRRR